MNLFWRNSNTKTGRVIFSRAILPLVAAVFLSPQVCEGNPDAKRLYDDLLSTYNRLIRPVTNNNNTVLVKLGLRLSQLIDLVSTSFQYAYLLIHVMQLFVFIKCYICKIG